MTARSASRWSHPSPARDAAGVRYGWMVTCPAVGCPWFEARADDPDSTDSTRMVVAALFDQHMDAEHPEHATY